MTILDSIMLVFGVAIAFVLIYPPANGPAIAFFEPREILLFRSVALAHGVTLSVSFVALTRTVTYRRMPHPAEWLAILLTFVILAIRNFRCMTRLRSFLPRFPGSTVSRCRLSAFSGSWASSSRFRS